MPRPGATSPIAASQVRPRYRRAITNLRIIAIAHSAMSGSFWGDGGIDLFHLQRAEVGEEGDSCVQPIVCVHTVPSLGSAFRRSGGPRWLDWTRAIGRLPQVRAQQMTWDAGDARNGRDPLGGYLPPLGNGAPFDAQFPSDQGPEPTTGGGAQQVHSGKDNGHPTTLRAPKPIGKPTMLATAHYLCRETEHRIWHTGGMTIGERIRAARTDAGLSQQDVARALGVGRSAVNQWESGLTKPSITKRAQLAVLLDMRITDLIPGMPVDEITEAIAQIIRAVPPSKQAGLVMMLEQAAGLLADPPPDTPAPRRTKKKQYS